MRVAFDARHAARGLGVSTFLTNLAGELTGVAAIELIWLGDPSLAPVGVISAVRADRTPYPLLDGPLGRALVRRLRPDVMHFTANTGWGRAGPAPTVLTLHDLIFLTSPATRGRSSRQLVGHAYERRLIERTLTVADVVAVPSQTVAGQVRERFGTDIQPRVVLEGVVGPRPRIGSLSAGQGPRQPYVVAFAGRDPRKRTREVVSAWRTLQPSPLRLVLLASGGLPEGLQEELGPELAGGRAEILDHLPHEQLWQILAGSLALAYPSTDEGFGLPVLEGMAAGTPVLAGLALATREIGGDAIVALDLPDIGSSLAANLLRLLEDTSWRAELVRRGHARAAAFTWRRTAEGYRDLYEEAVARHASRPSR